jgi:calcineurin-like phosphoesterase family protein
MERINAVVSKKDTLWILGDVIWSAADIAWINCLNSGNIKIVLGNHDPEASIFIDNGYKCYGALKKYGFWLTHIPIHPQEMRDLNNIHGHIHNPDKGLKDGRYFNVNWDFHHRPLEINEIRSMQKLRGSTYD